MYSGCKLPFETFSRNSQWEFSSLVVIPQNTGLRSATKGKGITRTQLLEIPSVVFDNLLNHIFVNMTAKSKIGILRSETLYASTEMQIWRLERCISAVQFQTNAFVFTYLHGVCFWHYSKMIYSWVFNVY